MATEFFLQPELEDLVTNIDSKDEWMNKVTDLQLEGQLSLTTNSEKKAASPYTFMNNQMKLVFETLCPAKSTVERYAKSVIPIEILSHVALCKQEGYFAKLEIWYDDKNPDPVLVGYLSNSYSSDIHIIARWGDEIIPYEQLVEKAINRYTKAFKLSAEQTKVECENAIENCDLLVQQLFAGQKSSWNINPSFQLRSTSF